MNNFVKILDEKSMFYYVNTDISSNLIESSLITLTIIFIVWSIKLAMEKE
ncbi:hypothetical protein [Campylobacter sp. RM5004]|nr:hypothetical protein [Campylobacter sp. RM5004]